MIGRRAGRSRGAPDASNPSSTWGDASSGSALGQRLVEVELSLLDELHRGDRRDGLGHRRDPDDGVEGHVLRLVDLALAEGALVDRARVVGGQRDDARHGPGGDGLL